MTLLAFPVAIVCPWTRRSLADLSTEASSAHEQLALSLSSSLNPFSLLLAKTGSSSRTSSMLGVSEATDDKVSSGNRSVIEEPALLEPTLLELALLFASQPVV